ncbi:Uu.00g062310.m01.CDS01 [Anthostomella pinea]|uniref:Uu.00g062310.m01.CDS01 n=1 Tax=Anthostomella pinea TaxID=933095 RepID=A0AAI8VT54_9PEZI|nr:Uu.00g062310.m01.CDS01 [Anthostomella pinea]
MRSRQVIQSTTVLLGVVTLTWLLFRDDALRGSFHTTKVTLTEKLKSEKPPPQPKYKPTPTFTPPPIQDPFPSLATATPPPIPKYNVPKKGIWKEYGLEIAPPLVIGFTRSYPMLLQAVVSYITAGWPPEQIYVIENTGMQQANARGQLSLQHPFHLNHTSLKTLGVNVVQTPVLLSFAQLQNFYLSLSYAHEWPYYFWSHMDVLALGHENGFENLTPRGGDPGYKSLYTLCLEELKRTLDTDDRWATRFFAYDHLTLQNPKALEDIGGWDTLIPYYMTDCDTYTRFIMKKWSQLDSNCGVITDTSVALDDLLALYRDVNVTPKFTDPNPPPPPPPPAEDEPTKGEIVARDGPGPGLTDPIEYWKSLLGTADQMFHYKHADRGRNTWQSGQHGGQGEPFYYDNAGFTEALDVLTEAGKEVFRRKWGHGNCDLIGGGGLKFEDQWRVLKDFE